MPQINSLPKGMEKWLLSVNVKFKSIERLSARDSLFYLLPLQIKINTWLK